MIKGVSQDMLHRYVDMRQKFDTEAKTIHSLASLLSLLQHCGDDKLEVDTDALGFVHGLIDKSILNIWEMLDDFIYIVEAQQMIERNRNPVS